MIVLYIQHKTGFDSKFRNRLADSEGNISRWRNVMSSWLKQQKSAAVPPT